MTSVLEDSPTMLGDGLSTNDGGAAAATPPGGNPVTRLLRRYEVVIGAVGVIVLIVRLAGGGFLADLTGSETESGETASVAPFTPEEPQAATPTTEATLPPVIENAL